MKLFLRRDSFLPNAISQAMRLISRPCALIAAFIAHSVFCLQGSLSAQSFRQLCPYLDSCNRSLHRAPEASDSLTCCVPCSCKHSCRHTANCCPDAEITQLSPPSIPCRHLNNIYSRHVNRSSLASSTIEYRVIDVCINGDATRMAMEDIRRCRKAETVSDLIFVTGINTGQTYLNAHCARCNGETEYIEWMLYFTSLTSSIFFTSIEQRDAHLFSYPTVKIVPPNSVLALTSACKITSTDSCNATGLWDVHNAEIEDKCQSFKNLFFHENRRWFYENVYCYMCNNPVGAIVPEQCGIIDDLINFRSTFTSFQALLVSETKTEVRQGDSRFACGIGNVPNPLSDTCTSLLCPPGYVPTWGFCKPIFEDIQGFVVNILFRLTFPTGINPKSLDLDLLFNDINLVILKLSRINAIRCEVCLADIQRFHERDDIFYSASFRSGEKCTHLVLLEMLFTINRRLPHPVPLNQLNLTAILSVFYGDTDMIEGNYNIIYSEQSSCPKALTYSPKQVYCPSIGYSRIELSKICDDKCYRRTFGEISVTFDNETSIACYNQFAKLVLALNSAQASLQDVKLLFIMFFLFHHLYYCNLISESFGK